MKKLLLSAIAAAFVLGVGSVTFQATPARADDKPKVDCTKKENVDNPACKKTDKK
jgi:hypothetical protein